MFFGKEVAALSTNNELIIPRSGIGICFFSPDLSYCDQVTHERKVLASLSLFP